MNDNFNYKKLTPFKWFVLENFPFIEADFDAITDWQLLCKLGEEINKIIDSTNILGTQVETLTDFVSNYFDNLDVQEEINNKLDEMAEGGQLEEIIAEYLQMAGLLCYNTVNDMKNATNLINGSFAKTFGKTTYNDGLGEFYKIREILNTDVVDNINIIALTNYNNLIAELIPNAHIANLQTQINNINNNVLTDFVVIGDSYTAFSNSTWAEDLEQQLHLTLHKHATSSMGYAHSVEGNTFLDLLDWSDTSFYNKVKYVICYGGINDYDQTRANIESAVVAFVNKAKTNFPNAQIILVGPQCDATQFASRRLVKERVAIERGAMRTGVAYVNAQNWLLNTTFNYTETYASDRLHPSELGYKIITGKMLGIINNICESDVDLKLSFNSGFSGNLRTTKEKTHTHFSAKITGTFTGGAYNIPIKIDGSIMENNANLDGFLTRDEYFPVYKLDANNNVSEFVGCGRITTSSQTGQYGIYIVPIVQTFTGTIVISGNLYMNWIDETSSD